MSEVTQTPEPLSDDLLKGAEAIAKYIGESRRRTFYLMERALIPCGKEGSIWVASRRALSAHYAKLTGKAA
ncbi:MAG: hypothetical protein JO001_10675 [Alphaproteobacteria bacterium]|nr:hypothetical protein [Alphaproteobacteria bacterium]